MKYTAIKGTSVFIVLEHSWIDKTIRPYISHDAVIHGVYSDRETANNKLKKMYMTSLNTRSTKSFTSQGYFCILKKTIEGRKPRIEHCVCKEYDLDEYSIKE